MPEQPDNPDSNNDGPVLVTGTAGFIGSHVARKLLSTGHRVIGFDNLNDYYDPRLKSSRLALFQEEEDYTHITGDLADRDLVETVFSMHRPSRVVHLAAQAGVRYAAENPHVYVGSNVTGTLHVLEGCRHHDVEHLVFASTSSVYGANTHMPFTEHDSTDHPLTLYAATKKANEAMAHSYAHLYGIPCTGLRFFTVYGPWGRPDMAPILFARAIAAGEILRVFSHGRHSRSFTYIDDVVEGVIRILFRPPTRDENWTARRPDPASSGVAPYRIYNIGHEHSIQLMDFIQALERSLNKKARMEMLPPQPGDVPDTAADVSDLAGTIAYKPKIDIEEGVDRFIRWFRDYYESR